MSTRTKIKITLGILAPFIALTCLFILEKPIYQLNKAKIEAEETPEYLNWLRGVLGELEQEREADEAREVTPKNFTGGEVGKAL